MADYSWIALYNDGGCLEQHDSQTGIENTTEKIDRARFTTFVLQGQYGPVLTIHLDKGDRFFYRRRTEMSTDPSVPPLIGYLLVVQTPRDGGAVQHGFLVIQPKQQWILPTVEAFGEFRNHPWFYQLEPLPVEQQRIGYPAE